MKEVRRCKVCASSPRRGSDPQTLHRGWRCAMRFVRARTPRAGLLKHIRLRLPAVLRRTCGAWWCCRLLISRGLVATSSRRVSVRAFAHGPPRRVSAIQNVAVRGTFVICNALSKDGRRVHRVWSQLNKTTVSITASLLGMYDRNLVGSVPSQFLAA